MSADGTIPEALHAVGTSSWYTPSYIVEAARAALGGVIDIDPASCEIANRTVRAGGYYNEAADGLAHDWHGTVFLNPPSPPRPWWKKLRGEIESGRVTRAVFVGYSIETLQQFQDDPEWFGRWHWCLPSRRVKYETTAAERLRVLRGRLAAGRASAPTLRAIDRLSALPSDALVCGDAPAHSSVVFGYGMTFETFGPAFAIVGVSRPRTRVRS